MDFTVCLPDGLFLYKCLKRIVLYILLY